jgi:hypothetical protein
MKARKAGNRHPLLIYKRTMNRLWGATIFLGLILLVVWGAIRIQNVAVLETEHTIWLLSGAAVSLAFGLFAFFAQNMAYVQPRRDHLRLVTPFLRMNIAYSRIRSIHPSNFFQLFPPTNASWGTRKFLEPFYGKTVVVVELTGYPINPVFLRLFLPIQMFSRQSKGFVLIVPDWMEFSTELESFRGNWMQAQKRRPRKPISPWIR